MRLHVGHQLNLPSLHFRLLLMSLYNVSINLKGLKYISESPGFIPLLWWLLSGEERGLPRASSCPAWAPAPLWLEEAVRLGWRAKGY